MRRLASDPGAGLNSSLYASAADTSEDPDFMMSSDNDAPQIYTLPPRVAARFQRPAANRRKSSAASSRRNSISSLHSQHSNRSNRSSHGGPQSTHLAQHLRRASIIESRKARLADRAAHAEKVRLRAAMAKAVPRSIAASEERALAAQQARERYLAQVAASCAEEVKRAKKVAEDMKEKKAAEHLKMKWDMEERLAEAEKRRLLYQQNLRKKATGGLPAVEEKRVPHTVYKPLSTEASVRMIQSAWRKWRRRRVIQEFAALGLSKASVMGSEFEDVGTLLSQEQVLEVTAKVLDLFGLPDRDEQGAGATVNLRTFLSSFLIVGHPMHVLSNPGEQEQDLIAKADGLVTCYEQLLSDSRIILGDKPSTFQVDILSQAYSSFCTAFSAWKAHDSSVLVQTMIAQFVELDAIWQTVKDDTNGGVAADYREGIRDNQAMLLVRLKKMVGVEQSKTMIKDAIRESRKSKAKVKKRRPSEARPRAAGMQLASESPTPIEETAMEVEGQQVSTTSTDLHAEELQRALQPIPDNRVLVHELAIDREYIIKPRKGLEHTISQAVFHTMRTDVEAGIGDRWILAMANTIRQRLLRLLTPGNSLHQLVSEVLDTTVIENQVRVGTFSYERFFSFMSTILPKLCAPFRDAEIKALTEDQTNNPDMIDRLAKVMHAIDLLLLDYCNFLLAANAPTLIAEAAGYEQRKFAQDLETGNITLANTHRWWRSARAKIAAEADRRNPENVTSATNGPTPGKIYIQGLVDLAISFDDLHDVDLPETLVLDKARLLRIRDDARKVVAIGSILLTAKNLLKRDVRSQWKAEASRMWNTLAEAGSDDSQAVGDDPTSRQASSYDEESTSTKLLSTVESAHAMPASTRTQLVSMIRRSINQYATHRLTDPVMKLLHHRLKAHVWSRCSASSASERVRAATTASSSLAASGLPEFVPQIGALVDELLKIAEVDRAAHGVWYDEMAAGVERDEGALVP